MKNMSVCICIFAGMALMVTGCGKPSVVEVEEGKYVSYNYSSDSIDNYKVPASASAPEKIKGQDKFLEIYNQRQAARQQARQAVAPRAAKPLTPPLAKMEDIEAAKKLVADLNGSVSLAPNKAITFIKLAASEGTAGLTVDSMKLFGRLADLESFSFEGTAFDDTMMAEFKDLKKIKSLSISNSNITSATLEVFAGYPELTTLELRRDLKLDNSSLEILQKMPKLETLSVLYNSFTNSGMNKISKVKTLKSVDVRGCPDVSDNGAKYLSRLPLVEELYFRGMITNAGVEYLTGAPKLRFVEFQDCNDIDANSAESFKKMPSLRELRIFRCKSFDDNAVTGIASIPFERLELRDLNLSNAGIAPLKGMKSLKVLELSELPRVDAAGLNELLATLSNLDEAHFFFIPLDDAAIAKIVANMPNLKRLTIRSVGVTDAGIAALQKLTKLETLDIRENDKFTINALSQLSGIKTLRRLYVSGTALSARENEAALRSLRSALPKCQVTD